MLCFQPPKDDVVTVLKDQNFRDEEIKLGKKTTPVLFMYCCKLYILHVYM